MLPHEINPLHSFVKLYKLPKDLSPHRIQCNKNLRAMPSLSFGPYKHPQEFT